MSREDKFWETVRKYLTIDKKPDVVLVIGLRLGEDGQWNTYWKASHWTDQDFGDKLPSGVPEAIIGEMTKAKIGHTAFNLVTRIIDKAPDIIREIKARKNI